MALFRPSPRLCRLANIRTLPVSHLNLYRHASNGAPPPKQVKPWREDDVQDPQILRADNFAQHAVFALNFVKRFIKFSFVGFVAVGVTVGTVFEASHQWVEHRELAPETDDEARRWEWDREAEAWSGGAGGGTDPGLGLKGRHAVRAAWMSQHWGIGPPASVVGFNTFSGSGGLNIVEARLEHAQGFLRIAIAIAEERVVSGKVRPPVLTELLTRHADVLERMGTKDALFEAKRELQRVWAGLVPKGVEAARVALKLGDLEFRLGSPAEGLSWCSRAINLTLNSGSQEVPSPVPVVPTLAPTSPLAQRTLASALVTLSAFYAKGGQLKHAQQVEEASLSLLRSILPPASLTSNSPPQALHMLYLLHRSSLLSIHLAEVLFALRRPVTTLSDYLRSAANTSERVALALAGIPPVHPDAPSSDIPHPPSSESPLRPEYASSVSMRRPASSLLRDARRAAAEAWNLLGVLSEEESPGKALECYERALGWAGVMPDGPAGIGVAGEGVLEQEWKMLWDNYVRARESAKRVK